MSTPTGSTERHVVPRSHRKSEFKDGNIKIGDCSKRLKSKLIAIKNPHSDGVRAIVNDKATAFLRLGRRRRMRR
ncbi:hypothetical protein HOY80DRAFT_1044563 [Tuber brumale]|nr:hypothetical protein HOY80DRAFT_1044563 [Tuber brumale]